MSRQNNRFTPRVKASSYLEANLHAYSDQACSKGRDQSDRTRVDL